jgi:hypothetical protein
MLRHKPNFGQHLVATMAFPARRGMKYGDGFSHGLLGGAGLAAA